MSKIEAVANPIWRALTTRQRELAEIGERAARYRPELSVLAGFEPEDDVAGGLAALAAMMKVGERVGVFYPSADVSTIAGLEVVLAAPLVQMVWGGGVMIEVEAEDEIALGAANADEMIALADLAKPGPFTPHAGVFVGIRDGAGMLIAMAGTRFRVPGATEVSGICTHPEHVGRGLAARLTRRVIARIQAVGEMPFLHVRGGNDRAIALYERLGFVATWSRAYAILARAS